MLLPRPVRRHRVRHSPMVRHWLRFGGMALATAGPRILFFQKKASISRADMAEQVSEQINELKDEIKVHRLELKSEMKSDRREFAILRSEVDAVQAEVMADLMQVKEIMSTLLDICRNK